jgi:hypothetical protein
LFSDPRNPNQSMRVGQAELASIFKNCVFIFILQMSIALIIALRKDESVAEIGIVSKGNEVTIIVARFICTLLMHKLLEK